MLILLYAKHYLLPKSTQQTRSHEAGGAYLIKSARRGAAQARYRREAILLGFPTKGICPDFADSHR
jgi:hypothetical protein